MTRLLLGALLLFSLAGPAALAAPTCAGILFPKATILNVAETRPHFVRETLIDFLQNNRQIPSFIKKTSDGDVPVILVNAETLPTLRPILEQSAGYMFVQQVGYRNDHGLMRTGLHIIDADTPGARGFGEIHATGLAWKHVPSYLARRQDNAYVMIETGYLLPKQDYEVISYYQRMRRAAIFRIPFTFGGGQRRTDASNLLENSGENCFGFCKGQTVQSNLSEISARLQKLGVADVHALMNDKVVIEFLIEAKRDLLKANVDDANVMKWSQFNGPEVQNQLAHVLPATLTATEKSVFINWILALDATKQYSEFQKKYKVSSDGGYRDLQNGQTSFVLIYDSMRKADSFREATYQSPGVFYTWDSQNQRPLP
jgi:hypothetical protein